MALTLKAVEPHPLKGDMKFFFLCLIARYVLLLVKSFVIDKKYTQQAINNAVF